MHNNHRKIDIGLRIRELIHQKKITKADLARRMSRAPQAITKLLGKSSMNTDSLQEIMEVAGIASSEIFEEAISNGSMENVEPGIPVESLEEINQLKMDLASCKKDVHFYKSQAEEKERMIKVLMGKE